MLHSRGGDLHKRSLLAPDNHSELLAKRLNLAASAESCFLWTISGFSVSNAPWPDFFLVLTEECDSAESQEEAGASQTHTLDQGCD